MYIYLYYFYKYDYGILNKNNLLIEYFIMIYNKFVFLFISICS